MKKPMPRQPAPQPPELQSLGAILKGWLVVNGVSMIVMLPLLTAGEPLRGTMGAAARSRVDRRTGAPVTRQIEGAEAVRVSEDEARGTDYGTAEARRRQRLEPKAGGNAGT